MMTAMTMRTMVLTTMMTMILTATGTLMLMTMMMMRHTVAIQEAARVAQRSSTASGFSFAAKTRNTFNW